MERCPRLRRSCLLPAKGDTAGVSYPTIVSWPAVHMLPDTIRTFIALHVPAVCATMLQGRKGAGRPRGYCALLKCGGCAFKAGDLWPDLAPKVTLLLKQARREAMS